VGLNHLQIQKFRSIQSM